MRPLLLYDQSYRVSQSNPRIARNFKNKKKNKKNYFNESNINIRMYSHLFKVRAVSSHNGLLAASEPGTAFDQRRVYFGKFCLDCRIKRPLNSVGFPVGQGLNVTGLLGGQ